MLGLLRVVNSVAGKHRGIMLAVLQHKTIFMTNQKDRHLEAPGEANRDKHINFLAVQNADEKKLAGWYSTIAHIGTHTAYHTGQVIYIRKMKGWWNDENGVK